MKLEWMGRNREFIRKLMKFVNLFSQYDHNVTAANSGISMNSLQWQTLECIIEFEEENKNMAFMADQLGVPKSTFSKFAKQLVGWGFVEKYQHTDNRKDIILKPSKKGYLFYKKRSQIILESAWKEPFSVLDKLSDKNLETVVECLSKMAADLEPENNKARKLFKLQME